MNTYLSNYIRFFQILSDMEQECLISQKEKHQLKVNLTLKDMALINMITINYDADDEDFKYSIINYLRKQTQSPKMRQPQKIRCKSTGMEMSPIKLLRRNSVSREVKVTEEQLVQQIDDLNDSLIQILQSDNKSVLTAMVADKLRNVMEVIQKSTFSSPSTTNTKIIQPEDNDTKMIDKFSSLYSDLKKHYTDYMTCNLLLMDDNLSYQNLLLGVRNFIKKIIDADQFSFMQVREDRSIEIYYSSDDTYVTLMDKNLYNETQLLQPNKIILLEECSFYPNLVDTFKGYKNNYLLKVSNQDTYVCFHVNTVVSDFLSIAEEFDIFEDMNRLSQFLVDTIKQAKIQIFTPLQLSHMIQGIGIAFIRSSKYLFIKKSIEILRKRYAVEKHINFGDGLSVISSPSLFYSSVKQVDFEFKDELNVSISINMDLTKYNDLMVYKQLTQTFNKYLKFIRQCYDKNTFYKFFVKSQDQLIFEFDKTGKLIFLSRPIPQEVKQTYNIHFDPKNRVLYSQLFGNEELLKYVENFLHDQDQNVLRDSDQQYQVFMKMEERSFKGFFVIFQQRWLKYDQKKFDLSDPSLQKGIKKQIIEQETIKYIDKLEQSNPSILNSVVQMFKPRSTQRQTVHYRNSILQFEPMKMSSKHSKNLTVEHLLCEFEHPKVDSFDFNIFQLNGIIEQQQVVVQIFKKHNLITEYSIAMETLCNFLSELEYKYNKNNNVFHNYEHGVSVMQNVHAILLQLSQCIHGTLLSKFNQMTLILSGLCHDVAHTGRTNTFEINSLSNLAIRYHDRSVLEQHHAAKSLKLLCVPTTNILQSLKAEEFRKFRRMFISNILYTDITEHFNLIKNFESRAYESNFGEQEEDVKLLSGMIIHTSDFTGGAKQFDVAKQWSFRVNKEFEQQYDMEGKLGYPQMPYMKDLHLLPVMAKQEAGFFKFIVRPLWQSMNKYLEDRLERENRFSLYYLEESEKYIQDLSAKVRHHNFSTGEERLERGKVHICSRTLIFEPERQELPIQKLFYKMITTPLKLSNCISFRVKRIVEIVTQGPPSPYIYQDDVDIEIQIEPLFDNIKTVFELIETILLINQKKHDVEGEVEKLDSEKLQKVRFNMSFVESVSEKPLIQKEMLVRKIMPLIQTKGIMYITNKTIYFQPFYKVTTKPCKKIPIEQIKMLYKRRFELMDIGLEIIMINGKTVYFAFENQDRMEDVYRVLIAKVTIEAETSLEKMQYLWQSGQISNFEYLMRLNQAGNRSTSDLTQYPVFPLVIIDYDSQQLNLTDPNVYRDLRKPIGALNEKRLQDFRKRYQDMPNPKFLYGTHYSTPGYVIGYLIRQKPQYMLKLQSGKFDKPDRLFKSIKGDFKNIMNNPTSLKELIPEFFLEDDSFLVNRLGLDLGVRQNLKKVGDVKLPKWARSASEFLKVNRQALESDYVSNEIHHWIDLIFGYKQKGPSSVEADNVFHYLTYEGTVQLSQLQDPIERQAITCQINEFGQCPKQLFKIPHPPKCALKAGQMMYKVVEQVPKQLNEEQHQNVEGLMWENLDKKDQFQNKVISKAHKSNITDMVVLEKKNLLVTVGQDGFLKVIDLKEMVVLKSFKVDEFCLSVIVTLKQDEIFAIGSWGSQIHVFNINYGSKVQVVQRFNNSVSSLVYLAKKKILVTGSWDCSLKRFECSENQIKQDTEEMIDDWEAQITNISAIEDESIIAVGDVDGKVITLNTNNWTQLHQFEINGEKIVKLLFFKQSLLVVGDSQIKMFSNGSQLLDFKIDKNNGVITDVLVDREKYLIASTKKGHVAIFSMLLESRLGHLFIDYAVEDRMVQPDQQFTKMTLRDKTLILASHNGSVNILQY